MLAPFLQRQARVIAAQLAPALPDAAAKLAKADPDPAALARELVDSLDLSDWATLVPELQQLLLSIAEDGIRVAFAQVGAVPSAEITEQVNAAALAWARDRAAELVGMRYDDNGDLVENPNAEWTITEATRDAIQGDVARAIEEGTSADDLADQLAESYGFSDARAETIARTELAMADIQGNMITYRDSGVVGGKQVILGSEHDDTSDCVCAEAAAMGVVDIDDDFGGLGDPPYHPNCVCDLVPVLADGA